MTLPFRFLLSLPLQFWCRFPKGRGGENTPIAKGATSQIQARIYAEILPSFWDPAEQRAGSLFNRLTYLWWVGWGHGQAVLASGWEA